MILAVYMTLLVLTACFIFFGRNYEAPEFEIIGLTFLFLLGVTLMLGGVSYPSGEVRSIVDVSVYNGSVVGVNTETNTTFSNYSGEIILGIQLHHFFGLFISIASAVGFILLFLNWKIGVKEL